MHKKVRLSDRETDVGVVTNWQSLVSIGQVYLQVWLFSHALQALTGRHQGTSGNSLHEKKIPLSHEREKKRVESALDDC